MFSVRTFWLWKTFSIRGFCIIENVFHKSFHTLHNLFRNSFFRSHFQDTNTTITLYSLCTPLYDAKTKATYLTFHSRWRCRRNFLYNTHHHGRRKTSTPLNNIHSITLLLNILARVFMVLWYSDGMQKANVGVQKAITN